MAFQVTIVDHKELEDRDGKIFTVYNILVEHTASKKKWNLRKRYKHFAYLQNALKDKYPVIHDFRFPNKSMFNTFSHSTKERRRSGFEDFLKLIIVLDPLPVEMEEFLELEDNMFTTYDALTAPKPLVSNAGDPPPIAAPWTSEPSDASILLNDSVSAGSSKKSNPIAKVLFTSYLFMALLYFPAILAGAIDVSNSTSGHVVLTFLSLGATVTLVRVTAMGKGA